MRDEGVLAQRAPRPGVTPPPPRPDSHFCDESVALANAGCGRLSAGARGGGGSQMHRKSRPKKAAASKIACPQNRQDFGRTTLVAQTSCQKANKRRK